MSIRLGVALLGRRLLADDFTFLATCLIVYRIEVPLERLLSLLELWVASDVVLNFVLSIFLDLASILLVITIE